MTLNAVTTAKAVFELEKGAMQYNTELKKCSDCLIFTHVSSCRKSGGRTDMARSKGKSPVVYEKAKRLHLSDI